MTKDEILAIQPGRELDALVEREIIFRDSKDDPDAQHVFKTAHLWCKSYSTDISAAWEVVEKMKREGWSINITSWGDNETMGVDPYLVTFGTLGGPNNFMNEKLPEAICKAALLSLIQEDTPND